MRQMADATASRSFRWGSLIDVYVNLWVCCLKEPAARALMPARFSRGGRNSGGLGGNCHWYRWVFRPRDAACAALAMGSRRADSGLDQPDFARWRAVAGAVVPMDNRRAGSGDRARAAFGARHPSRPRRRPGLWAGEIHPAARLADGAGGA